MKKLINRPDAVVREMLDGFLRIYPKLQKLADHPVLLRLDAEEVRNGQVAVISGGGSGHEPAHAGYIGAGMLSAAVAGEVFTSPPVDSVAAAIRAVTGPPGALLIVKNYTGDRLNFGLAAEMVRGEGIGVENVIVADDIALAETHDRASRRGIAGTVLVHKIAGAAAAQGRKLQAVAEAAQKAADSIATMGLSLSAGIIPAVGKPGYTLGEQEVELGLGIHGEPGVRRLNLETADELAERITRAIISAHALKRSDRVVVLVNNLGATTQMELAIFARKALLLIEAHGCMVERVYAGTFMTSLEAAGVSLSVMRVNDEQLELLDAPTSAPAWPKIAAVRPSPAVERVIAPRKRQKSIAEHAGAERITALERAIKAACKALIDAESRLTDMDRIVGDGDLGINMARTAKAIQNALPGYPLYSPVETLRRLSLDVQRLLGGSSGPFYGVFLLRVANSLAAGDSWAKAALDGCQAISELGGAVRGDRTMLDALLPFAESFSRSADLKAAVEAAQAGAEATAQMKPKRGRSTQLGDRAVGHPDPGAGAVAIWLRAVASAI
jgi:dihydroxyacetone kinase